MKSFSDFLTLKSLCWITVSLALVCELQVAKANAASASESYEMGEYATAYQAIDELSKSRSLSAEDTVLKARILFKLQRYDLAAIAFEEAKKKEAKDPSLAYELGQSYFACQNFKKSIAAFAQSANQKYRVDVSTYYAGVAYQNLHDLKAARRAFERVTHFASDPNLLKQPAWFQWGDTELAEAETIKDLGAKKKRIEINVLPKYQEAIRLGADTATGKQAAIRDAEIRSKYFPVVRSPWTLSLKQSLQWDSNVVPLGDESRIVITEKDSAISTTSLNVRREIQRGRWSFTPFTTADLTLYSQRQIPRVFQNDSLSARPGVLTEFDHTFLKKPATASFEYAFTYLMRDYSQQHRLRFYSRTHQWSLGQKWSRFAMGPTTLKASLKLSRSEAWSYSANAPGVQLSQGIKLQKDLNLFVMGSAEWSRAFDPRNDLDTYRAMASATWSDVFWLCNLKPSLTVTAYDTLAQQSTRGTEILYNPQISIDRPFWGLKWEVSYGYSKRSSQDQKNFEYSKHILGLELQYSIL